MKKKGKHSSEEKILANFLAHSRVWQTSVNTLYGSTKYFANYCGSYRINSVTPKKLLKTQLFEKKSKFSSEKKFLACFFSYSRVWQTWGANRWISTIFFTITFEIKGIISVTPKKLLKTQNFEKGRQVFQWKKVFVVFSPDFSSVIDLRG